MSLVIVLGLGPASADLITARTRDLLASEPHIYLRTARHPAASIVADAATFDHVYDESSSLDAVYERIAELLIEAASEHGRVVYAVPGSPAVGERTVGLLAAAAAKALVKVEIHPALSFLDLTWSRIGIDPVATGVRVVDGHRFEVEAAGERGPLLVAQCDSSDVLSRVKLAIGDALETRSELGAGLARHVSERGAGVVDDDVVVTVLQRLGLPDEHVYDVVWHDLDRVVEPDHLTSLWIPFFATPVAFEVERFAELVATLRRECPWDREQTHESLKRHLLEETYEVLEALDHLDTEAIEGYTHLEEELGDLLFQIVFHSTLAAEAGQFTLADVARGIHDKLYSRHPHVFGDVNADSAAQVVANWEDIKKAEKGRKSIFDGVPDALPALLFALKVQKKAAAVETGSHVADSDEKMGGLDLDTLVARARAALDADAIGDLIFAVVDLARRNNIDAEAALRSTAVNYRDEVKRQEPT